MKVEYKIGELFKALRSAQALLKVAGNNAISAGITQEAANYLVKRFNAYNIATTSGRRRRYSSNKSGSTIKEFTELKNALLPFLPGLTKVNLEKIIKDFRETSGRKMMKRQAARSSNFEPDPHLAGIEDETIRENRFFLASMGTKIRNTDGKHGNRYWECRNKWYKFEEKIEQLFDDPSDRSDRVVRAVITNGENSIKKAMATFMVNDLGLINGMDFKESVEKVRDNIYPELIIRRDKSGRAGLGYHTKFNIYPSGMHGIKYYVSITNLKETCDRMKQEKLDKAHAIIEKDMV